MQRLQLQEICEPIFDSVKPPGMKKIGFRKLQFGDAPIRIESVKMNRARKEGVFLELDFRWAGDPDIQLAIDTFGVCVPLPFWLHHIGQVPSTCLHLSTATSGQ
jgi:hypothetical protein